MNANSPEWMGYKDLLNKIQWFAESLYQQQMISFYECCSLDTMQNTLAKFKELNYVKMTIQEIEKEKKAVLTKERLIKVTASVETLQKLEEHLKLFVNHIPTKTENSPLDIAKKSLSLHLNPFLSKL